MTGSSLVLDQDAPSSQALTPAHVVVIIMENEGINQTYNCGINCDYITSLASQYGLAENFSSVAHISLLDYLTLLNGTNFAYPGSVFTKECSPSNCRVNGTNVLDEISGSGQTWRAYLEDYVGGCQFTNLAGHRSVEYDDKHNPFVYMAEAHSSPAYCMNLVDANPTSTGYLALPTKLLSDLNNLTSPAPNFLWLTPNNCDNGHDDNATITFYNTSSICPLSNNVQAQNNYLKVLVPAILNSTTFTTSTSLLVITWDEGVACPPTNDPAYPETFPICIDRVTTIFAGSDAQPHHISNKGYSHYGFLPTLEEILGIPPLPRQVNGPTFDEFLTRLPLASHGAGGGGGGRITFL
jgi:phosphatidylinositol-3-phosphatase